MKWNNLVVFKSFWKIELVLKLIFIDVFNFYFYMYSVSGVLGLDLF